MANTAAAEIGDVELGFRRVVQLIKSYLSTSAPSNLTSTDQLPEGVTNKYFTQARVNDIINPLLLQKASVMHTHQLADVGLQNAVLFYSLANFNTAINNLVADYIQSHPTTTVPSTDITLTDANNIQWKLSVDIDGSLITTQVVVNIQIITTENNTELTDESGNTLTL